MLVRCDIASELEPLLETRQIESEVLPVRLHDTASQTLIYPLRMLVRVHEADVAIPDASDIAPEYAGSLYPHLLSESDDRLQFQICKDIVEPGSVMNLIYLERPRSSSRGDICWRLDIQTEIYRLS